METAVSPSAPSPGPKPSVDDSTDAFVDAPREVWDRIHARVEELLRPADAVVSQMLTRALDLEASATAVAGLGMLGSWLGDLGMVAAARLARQVRDSIETQPVRDSPDVATAVQVAGLIEDLRSSVATSGGGASLSPAQADRLLVIGEPSQPLDSLIWYAVTKGFSVHHSIRLGGWPKATDAVVVVGTSDRATAETLLTSRSAREQFPGVPLVVLHVEDDPQSSIDLARFATSMMPSSARPAIVLDEVRRHIHLHRRVDSFAVFGERSDELASALAERGFESWAAESSADFVRGLEGGRASGAVLMPASENAGLVRLLRAQPSTRNIVIVELVPGVPGGRLTGRRPGVDLVLAAGSPVDDWLRDLQDLVRERADVDAELVLSSGAGGVPWSSATFLAERLLLGIHRSDSVASLAVIQYDVSDPVIEIDKVQDILMREFRTDDIVTRSADRETILVLGGVAGDVASLRLERITARLASVGTRVGIAEFPYDAQSVTGLVDQARATLARSLDDEGPRVATTDWRAGELTSHDVIVADSDPAVARVIGDALTRCGLTVAHVRDGHALLERLSDRQVRLPKILMLEFDLEGIDGLTVLRRLQPQAAVHRFDVVMLSARSRESDVQQAFDLGVTEVFEKPFAPGILVRRLLRILEDDG